jgi:hypothetical protein
MRPPCPGSLRVGGEEVACLGVEHHALRCLGRLADGRWVHFDESAGASPPLVMDRPLSLFRMLEFHDPALRPTEWKEAWTRSTSRSS